MKGVHRREAGRERSWKGYSRIPSVRGRRGADVEQGTGVSEPSRHGGRDGR
jgi:hypothetical protein